MWGKLKLEIRLAVSAILTLIGIGTVIFHKLENWTWIQSFYFSVVTVTTVGYGDIVPSSDLTRLFTSIYILAGVAIVIASLGIIGSSWMKHKERQITNAVKKLK